MARKCKCCTRDIVGSKCLYCGYINVEVLDDSGSELEQGRVAQYKAGLLESLTGFSIEAKEYKWNDNSKKMDVIRTIDVKIANGKDCYNKVVWANQSFGQSLDDGDQQSEKSIVINYMFKGQKNSETVKITPVQCDDFWKIGVMINEDLTFKVFLGTDETKSAKSDSIQLKLK